MKRLDTLFILQRQSEKSQKSIKNICFLDPTKILLATSTWKSWSQAAM